MLSQIISVKGNPCPVRVLETLLGLKGEAQDIAVYHAILKVLKILVEVGLQTEGTILFH